MATTSSRQTSGVGGKIPKSNNRKFQRITPYSRPQPPPPSSSSPNSDDVENPNWFSGLIYPAKVIANGAGKIISFFNNDYSSDSSDVDSSENEEDDGEEIENDVSCQEDDQFDKVLSSSDKSDSKHAIEQLVIQESYSRKEANELIKLVKSRIVDTNGTFGETTPNMRTTAIMEARKWLQDKRSGSKKKFENELDFPNLASPYHISRNEKGSPVDMARSYMQNRPAWASPSLKQAEVGSSSPMGILHFKDETPKSTQRSSELKRGSYASGSWNLLEEIRRVRTKASEELLASAPLSKTILSPFSPESGHRQECSSLNKVDTEGTGLAESAHDRLANVLENATVGTPSRVSQDGDTVQSVEHKGTQEAVGLTYNNNNNEVKLLKGIAAENGFGCFASGLAQGQDATHETRPSDEGNGNLGDSSEGGHDIHVEDNLDPQEEPVIDITTDDVINCSQNSSSIKHDGPSQDASQPITIDDPAEKVKDTPKERKSRGYTRRGKGKGR